MQRPDNATLPLVDDQLVSRASHDLRAPIRHIRLLAGWLVEDHADELSGGAREKLAELDRCAGRLEALVGGLTDYLRLGTGDPPREWIDADRLVADVIAGIDLPGGVTVTVDGTLPGFRGARERMARLFAALIGNAVRHREGDGGRVAISGTEAAGGCVFRVRDDGPGIPPEFRETVFEPFRALRPQDESEGSGMGLATARRIVAQHGGRIWVEDNDDAKGVCLVFTVGRRPDGAGAHPEADESDGTGTR